MVVFRYNIYLNLYATSEIDLSGIIMENYATSIRWVNQQ